ncbi:MAG: polB [Chloroflexi bacterium]|nr:MAG: polB [Chloroflexota bacterium]
MNNIFRGWLLDLYEDANDGVRLWFISEDGERVCVRQPMPITFYAAGEAEQLRALWKMLRKQAGVLSLSREIKRDVFLIDPLPVLQATIDNPLRQTRLFREVQRLFPHLTYYDSDISATTRHSAQFGTFPMAFCELEIDESSTIQTIRVLNSRWDLAPVHPVFRILTIEPDCDPGRGSPKTLRLRHQQRQKSLPLDRPEDLIMRLNELLEQIDPDFILTQWGDNWVIPTLLKLAKQVGVNLHLNRDVQREVHWQKELTYFSYGQIVYRAEEAHLFGRCHIDQHNAMMWRDYGLDGVLESARVTAQSIERAARVSPGSGISAMQMLTALENQILVPWHKQQVEEFKTGVDLIQRDRGGLIYQPIVGLHANVGQIDFVSMYPAIIIKGNISPEVPLPNGIAPASEELGVVPLTLKPLYEKRVALKLNQAQNAKENPLSKRDKARSSALKWLLVVCFGFLGYKNARFGRIEAHEAVTNGGREVLLRAKETAEAMGFEVLHLYVDALWLKKSGATNKKDFQEVLDEISRQTGLGVSLDGVYRWVAFLPSRLDSRVPVANRYFGVFQDGSLKVRGIEARRRDTPAWVVETQTKMLNTLSEAMDVDALPEKISAAFEVFRRALKNLREGRVPIEKLVITSLITRELESYRAPTPAARAAMQMFQQTGKRVRPGQKMRFLYTRGEQGVSPWEVTELLDPARLDKKKYIELLARAASSVLYPFGIGNNELKQWGHSATIELSLNYERQGNHVRSFRDHVRTGRVESHVGIRGSSG